MKNFLLAITIIVSNQLFAQVNNWKAFNGNGLVTHDINNQRIHESNNGFTFVCKETGVELFFHDGNEYRKFKVDIGELSKQLTDGYNIFYIENESVGMVKAPIECCILLIFNDGSSKISLSVIKRHFIEVFLRASIWHLRGN